MAYRELTMLDVRELLRRFVAEHSIRAIARETGTDRKTVRRYLDAAKAVGLSADAELTDELVHEVAQRVQARPLPPPSEQRQKLAEHRAQLEQWLVERKRPLKLTKVHELLERRGVEVHYSTLRRYVHDELGWRQKTPTVRVDDPPPAQEAQADFGKMGRIYDPQTGKWRTLWALIVTLSFSRYQFVWPTFVQTTEAVCEGLDAAWRFFDGMVERLIVDNLTPVVKKSDPHSPTITAAFMDYVQARDLYVDPARVRKPKDKPRVENQVPYVRESCFDGEELGDLDGARRHARQWCLTTAGGRTHGTTRQVPRQHYETEEKPHMREAPTEPFDVPKWTHAKVHPDHHIQVFSALYSMPTDYIGEQVRVRGDKRTVRIYFKTECVKVHPRQAPGGRATDPEDYPKHKAAYAFRNVEALIAQAEQRGEHIGVFAHRLLEGPNPWTRMRAGYKLVRLCDKYGNARVEVACQRALAFDVIDVGRIERMLKQALVSEQEATEGGKLVQLSLPTMRFARSPEVFETRGRDDGEEQR